MKKAHEKTHISHWHFGNLYPWQPQPRPSVLATDTNDAQDMSLSISSATQSPARERLPSDSALCEMYGPLDQEDIEQLVRISATLNVPHNWVPDVAAVCAGILLCVTTRHIVDTIACEFARRIDLGPDRRVALSVRRERHGWVRWVLYFVVERGAIRISNATEPIDADNDKETVDSMEESTVNDTSVAGTQALAPPPSRQQQATAQSPVALLGLYSDMTVREAIRVLSIADALADVPHQLTAQPVGNVVSTVHDLYAPLGPLKKRADSIHQYVGGQQRVLLCALNVGGAYTHLRMAVERPASTPKTQTADDLLDLYPDVTAREAIALGRVIRALTGTPTEWVASGSGHVFEDQGPFAPTESVAQRIADAVRPLVLSRSLGAASALHHAVLTIDRDGDTGNLVYRFAVVPTPSRQVRT
ncbi:hypothetical protein TW95_gp1137 [Pandoravirus inopinatum]|uniref:DUF5860 domain-containing protein n=1 Tax=Pandoravirus inopinatum TaxID=1605721 RepID=A0A0B5JAC7_9VIRU|nr:hypothetical protein TW95_gp1137 [Pandoravirus inopinatum]AJF97871.1 hypothetical protein [Pandoravirus inopinatum]